ncbi:hypothetical protein CCO03_11785 [Comamonas serinivorans]|uniref:Uncharacterized protein n=1 Tax=Comamonas serinivorans TaxID=1082851 RepID=A0A1Y0EPN9_9BURK|nr:hypothetical protein [Comamonas serinivorans]ARU05269.1 hypothetical protein CCO03_11785 [Comamonas serinivorans]
MSCLPFLRDARSLLLGLTCTLALCAQAHGQAQRLDDSASPRQHIDLTWQSSATGQLTAVSQTEYRLATLVHVGRSARIYLVMPALIPGVLHPGALRLQWQGQVLAPGRAQPGDRVLVWSGPVKNPYLTDTLSVRIDVDPNGVRLAPNQAFRFEPYFEIEVLP